MVQTLVRVESCCPQLALSFWLYRSGWGSWEWGLVARKVSPDMALQVEWGGGYLWFSGFLLALWLCSYFAPWSFPASSCFGEGRSLCLL